jgi:hypothetical protein
VIAEARAAFEIQDEELDARAAIRAETGGGRRA